MGINRENSGAYIEGNVELKKVFEEGIHPLGEKTSIFLKDIADNSIINAEVEKVSSYIYKYKIKADSMKENSKYLMYAKISSSGLYTADSVMERQLDTINSVKSSIETKGYKLEIQQRSTISIKKIPRIFKIATDTINVYGIHNNNGTDYVAGNAIVFLRDQYRRY